MKYLKLFEDQTKEPDPFSQEEEWEEVDEEKAKIIAEIMEIEMNDPLSGKYGLDEKGQKIVDIMKKKLPEKLDNIDIEDLKVMKHLSEMQIEMRKYMAEHDNIIRVTQKLLQDIMVEIFSDEDLLNDFN
jgi:hypothetical protein